MRTTQYSLVLISQILLLCAIFTVGGRIVDLALTKARAADTCAIDRSLAAQQDGLGRLLAC